MTDPGLLTRPGVTQKIRDMTMMKKKNYVYTLLLALGLIGAACSSDPSGGDTPPPTPPVPSEPGYFSVSFVLPSQPATRGPLTRATEEFGTSGENLVDGVWILLYDAATDELAYAWDLKVRNYDASDYTLDDFHAQASTDANLYLLSSNAGGGYDGPTETVFRTVGQQVDGKDYKLVVLANLLGYSTGVTKFTNTHSALEPTDPFYKLNDLLAVTGGSTGGNAPYTTKHNIGSGDYIGNYQYNLIDENQEFRFIFMSNANGVVPVPASKLQPSVTAAQDYPVSVNLDRALAKIVVNMPEGGSTVYDGGTVTDFYWGLKRVNTKSYLIRQYADLAHAYGTMETYEHSIVVDRDYLYATDPNFGTSQSKSDFIDDAVSFDNSGFVDAFFSTNDPYHLQSWNNVWDDDPQNPGTNILEERYWKYTYENTADFTVQQWLDNVTYGSWSDYMTHIVAYVFIEYPTLKTGALGDATGDYFSFNAGTDSDPKWKVFTIAQAKEWAANDSYPTDMLGLKALVGHTDQTTVTNTPGASSYFDGSNSSNTWDPDAFAKPAASAYTIAGTHPITGTPITRHTVLADAGEKIFFHPAGLNIYTAPIKHYLSGSATDLRESVYAHYGVVRNNVYRLNIKSITGPGTPSLAKGFLSVDVTIQPWYVRDDSNINLEKPY